MKVAKRMKNSDISACSDEYAINSCGDGSNDGELASRAYSCVDNATGAEVTIVCFTSVQAQFSGIDISDPKVNLCTVPLFVRVCVCAYVHVLPVLWLVILYIAILLCLHVSMCM